MQELYLKVRELYVEVVDFLSKSGGAYQKMDSTTYHDIIDAILENRYRVSRNSDGNISAFTAWWMIYEADIELVKNGGRPADISTGSVVYVADHAGTGAYPDLIRFIRSTIGRRGVCWHHRYKQPGQFRYFPKKVGANA